MRTSYTYRTVDIKSNVVLEDIDLQDVSFSIKLNDIGDLTGKLFVPESKRGFLLDAATFPGRTGLYVMRNGVPVWGGIIWKRSWDEDSSTFSLSCGSWESYAYHVLQLTDKKYTSSDQLVIANELITGAGIPAESGITVPSNPSSGRMRERTMWRYEFKTVGNELERLAALENGFDYYVRNFIKPDGSFGREYVWGYPSTGRSASLTPSSNSLTFDYPGNLAPFGVIEDSENGASTVWMLGAGEGQLMISAGSVRTDYATAGWPKLELSLSNKDVSVQATLQAQAHEEVTKRAPPVDSWNIQLAPDSDVKLNDIQIGDSAVFRLASRRWKEPKVMIRRIVEIKVRPGDQGEIELVDLGLADEKRIV